jgi:hypothetical protein
MDWARAGSLLDWRAALPLALCYQELLRGADCFELNGANIARHPGFFLVDVDLDKNNPDGLSFRVSIDPKHPYCVGQFLSDYVDRMGIVLGNASSFFACKISWGC